MRNRILDGFSYYDKELIKADNGKGLAFLPDPQNRPSSSPLKPAPHEEPSTTMLFFMPNPHERPSTSLAPPQEL